MFKQIEENKYNKEREKNYKTDSEGQFNLQLKYTSLVELRAD